MKDLNLKLIENPDYVMTVIERIKSHFETETFQKYNQNNRDANSYYLAGHSPSFARILNNIFYDLGTFYDDFSYKGKNHIGHVITKIGEHFYGVSGIVDCYVLENSEQFQECSKDDFLFLEEFNCKKDEHNDEIQEELISYGKDVLQSLLANHNDCLTRKLGINIPRTK